MKNQNDLIFSIVFGVLGLIAFGIAIATKPVPPTIAAPPSINVADAALPTTAVVYGTALPNGGTGAAGGGGGFPGAMGPGGPMGMRGPGAPPGTMTGSTGIAGGGGRGGRVGG